jgi:hypothetical protein
MKAVDATALPAGAQRWCDEVATDLRDETTREIHGVSAIGM